MKRTLLVALVLLLVGVAAPRQAPPHAQAAEPSLQASSNTLSIASFNIQFLGLSTQRDHVGLALILRDFDLVVIQELVSPPFEGRFPDGSAYNPDPQSAEFFTAMQVLGFAFVLSEEDTGTGPTNHNNGSATEWWAVFFKPNRVETADDLPTEFLAEDRTDHGEYERVPHAFAFRTLDGRMDFVLISVHLEQGDFSAAEVRRREELIAVRQWVDDHDDVERDFIILGDMNIQDCEELAEAMPPGYRSLNDECEATNTNVNGPKPYDHVFFRPGFSREIDRGFDFRVYNLIEAMRPLWNSVEPYPGGSVNPIGLPAYDHNRFRQVYSDHHPVVFRLIVPLTDDD